MDNWLTSIVNWGCGHQPFRFCCSVLPDMNESTSTRLMFTFFLFIGVIIEKFILSSCGQTLLTENFPDLNITCLTIESQEDCQHVISYLAIYRLSIALVIFYFIFALICYGIENSRNCRAGIHNGFWFVKFILLFALCTGAIIIPTTHKDLFITVWKYIISIGSMLYSVVQLYILINLSHSWTENWLTRAKKSNTKLWFIAMVTSGMLFFSIFTCGVILMFAEAISQKNCSLNRLVIGINLSLCLLMAFTSVLPYAETYTGDSRSGLLQSAIVSCYILYLSWSAFSSTIPNSSNSKLLNYCNVTYNNDVFVVTGIIIVFLVLIYASTHITLHKEGSSTTVQRKLANQCEACCPVLPNLQTDENDGSQIIIKNELQHVAYSYTSWHLLLSLAVMYCTIQLTNWSRPKAISGSDDNQILAIWMKIISSWLCLIVYFWLLLPACYKQIFKKVVNTFDNQSAEDQV